MLEDAEPTNPRWWRELYRRLDRYIDECSVELYKLHHAGLITVATSELYTPEGRRSAAETADDLVRKIAAIYFPWMQHTEGTKLTAYQRMAKAWIDHWGDPRDPRVAAKIKATADWLMRTDKSQTARRR